MIARIVLSFIVLAVVGIGPSVAADQRALLQRIAIDFIVPRYQALADTASRQQAAWDRYCASPSPSGVADLDAAFHATADAWSALEFLRFGPMSKEFRHERMAHWPERRNAVSRALSSLLAWNEADILNAERFASASVAGQGLTALERLLFDDGGKDKLQRGPDASRRCAIGRAIARSLATVSEAVLREWTASDGTLAGFATADEAALREALTRIATDHLAIYQFVGDLKLGAVMGREAGEARAALAEGRRSGRSTRAVILNLEAAHDLTRIALGTGDDQVLDALGFALSIARDLPPEFAPLADDSKQRSRLVLMRDAIWSAQQLSNTTIPPALGITLGFNSLDGD